MGIDRIGYQLGAQGLDEAAALRPPEHDIGRRGLTRACDALNVPNPHAEHAPTSTSQPFAPPLASSSKRARSLSLLRPLQKCSQSSSRQHSPSRRRPRACRARANSRCVANGHPDPVHPQRTRARQITRAVRAGQLAAAEAGARREELE